MYGIVSSSTLCRKRKAVFLGSRFLEPGAQGLQCAEEGVEGADEPDIPGCEDPRRT